MVVQIAASLLGADHTKLKDEIAAVIAADTDFLHLDVMDGIFVPTQSIFWDSSSVKTTKAEAQETLLDVHLMVQQPLLVLNRYLPFVDYISVHVEAEHCKEALRSIRSAGKKAGIALNPTTAVEIAFPLLDKLDFVLIMSVIPGKGGQAYISSVGDKIARLCQEIKQRRLFVSIEVDGGIKKENAYLPISSGADILVVGTGIFHEQDYHGVIRQLKQVAYIGADHAGWELKEQVKKYLFSQAVAYQDLSGVYDSSDDYPAIAHAVGEAVAGTGNRGLLFCGSGVGVSIAANKVAGVRAAPLFTQEQVRLAREHNDLNVLCLSGKTVSLEAAKQLLPVFFQTAFSGGRHERRVKAIES